MLPPPNEDNRIAELMRRVENLESALRAAFTTISGGRGLRIDGGGGITIADGGQFRANYPAELGGGEMLYVGDIYSVVDGSYQGTGLLLQGPDGTDLMVIRTDAEFGTTMHNIYDSGGRIIFGNDASSGQGIARPYLSGGFRRARQLDWGITTTSATFETLWQQYVYKQHPQLTVGLIATMDTAGATGEVRVTVDGVQLDTVRSAEFLVASQYFTGPVAGSHMQIMDVQIQGRRTSASGALRIEPQYWIGRQS